MSTNKASRDTMLVVAVIVAVVVTVLANLLADKKFKRLDLTAEGRYSLSPSFIRILGRLEDPLKLTYYVSENAPPGFDIYRRDMLDKLREVELAANGKIQLEVIDPTEKKELRERLEKNHFKIEMNVYQKDQLIDAIVFTGMELLYQDKPVAQIPRIVADEVEYALGSQIIELTTKKKPIIAFNVPPTPQQNPQMAMMGQQQGSGYEWLSQGGWDREKKFDIRSVEITEASPIPPEAALLIVIRPKSLNDRQKYELTRYVAGGGHLLLVTAPFKLISEFGWHVEKSPSGLEDYLKDLGITFNPNFIADNSNVRLVPVQQFLFRGQKPEEQRLPYFVRVVPENIDQESVLTKLLPGLVAPFPAAIELDNDKIKKSGLKEQILAKTSKQTWTVPFSEAFNPESELNKKYDEETQHYEGNKNIFVMLEGQFPFPYEGKPVPEWGAPPPNAPPEEKKEKKDEPSAMTKKPGTIALISSPDAFHSSLLESNLGQFMQGNYFVITNMAENFSMGDDLIRIRTKRYETRVIKGLGGSENDFKRKALKVGLLFGMPGLLLIFALSWFAVRRMSQMQYERKFAQTIGPSSFTP